MADLAALRGRLKDRQVKDGALGTIDIPLCLDLGLISELEHLQEEQARWSVDHAERNDSGSLAGKAKKPVNPFDAQVEARQAEIRAASIVVVFRGISSQRYQDLVNQFDEPDGEQRLAWLDSLVAACFHECWSEGEKTDLSWPEIKPELAFGEEDEVRTKVFNLNRRRPDIPFSLRPSKTGRQQPVTLTSPAARK